MAIDGKEGSLERKRTDESLRGEREKTDRALAENRTAVEADADRVLGHARDHADEVLIAARRKADTAEKSASHAAPDAAIEKTRVLEDAAVRAERIAADESVRTAREESALALAKLLPLERDKTDRYLLTERARSDDALSHRDDFLGIVSHDLRNLLGGIVMSASVLAQDIPESMDNQTLIGTNRIRRYAARMNRLIGDLLDVASIDVGRLAMTLADGDGTTIIDEAADTFHAAASAKGITLKSVVVERPLMAPFDHERMLQVFANLITNAIKFTPEGGAIELRGERSGEELRFCVSDTGAGIPDEMLEAVFERFWQVGKNDRRGLGLGLYIAKCIVEAHDGRIWAESKPGRGSRFYFTLPSNRRAPKRKLGVRGAAPV